MARKTITGQIDRVGSQASVTSILTVPSGKVVDDVNLTASNLSTKQDVIVWAQLRKTPTSPKRHRLCRLLLKTLGTTGECASEYGMPHVLSAGEDLMIVLEGPADSSIGYVLSYDERSASVQSDPVDRVAVAISNVNKTLKNADLGIPSVVDAIEAENTGVPALLTDLKNELSKLQQPSPPPGNVNSKILTSAYTVPASYSSAIEVPITPSSDTGKVRVNVTMFWTGKFFWGLRRNDTTIVSNTVVNKDEPDTAAEPLTLAISDEPNSDEEVTYKLRVSTYPNETGTVDIGSTLYVEEQP